MLKAIPRNTPLFQAILICCFLLLILVPVYLNERHDPRDPSNYLFITNNFMFAFFICFAVCTLLFFYFKTGTKTFTIADDIVEVKFYLQPKQHFLLSQINKIEWTSKQKEIQNRGGSATASGDAITLVLENGDVFEFDVTEYKNFDELRAWFLTYGRDTGIIKIEPINNRGRG